MALPEAACTLRSRLTKRALPPGHGRRHGGCRNRRVLPDARASGYPMLAIEYKIPGDLHNIDLPTHRGLYEQHELNMTHIHIFLTR